MSKVNTTEETIRRPRDRKASILAAAAERFHRFGYGGVAMSDVAADVGITAGALYRHVRSKRELLLQTVLQGMDTYAGALAVVENLDELAAAFAALTLEQRRLPVLWQREARNLLPEEQRQVRERFREVAHRVVELLRAERPQLADDVADLLAWAGLAVLTSPSHHSVRLPQSRYTVVLRDLAAAVFRSPLPTCSSGVAPGSVVLAGSADEFVQSGLPRTSVPGAEALPGAETLPGAGVELVRFSRREDLMA